MIKLVCQKFDTHIESPSSHSRKENPSVHEMVKMIAKPCKGSSYQDNVRVKEEFVESMSKGRQ
jgi:hypothetical protein